MNLLFDNECLSVINFKKVILSILFKFFKNYVLHYILVVSEYYLNMSFKIVLVIKLPYLYIGFLFFRNGYLLMVTKKLLQTKKKIGYWKFLEMPLIQMLIYSLKNAKPRKNV